MRVLRLILATGLAIAVQTTVDRWFAGGRLAVDLVLVMTVYTALSSGPVAGIVTGSFAGLVQDALSGGVLGMAGLSKTVVGYLAGVVGAQFILVQMPARFVVFFVSTLLNAALFVGGYEALGLRHFATPWALVVGQALGNAVVGVLLFELAGFWPRYVARRQARGR